MFKFVPPIMLCLGLLMGLGAGEEKRATPDAWNTESLRGLTLLGDHNCTSCHGTSNDSLLNKQAPLLDNVGERLHPDYLEAFIAHPQKTKPGTTMPHALGESPPDTAKKIAHFLRSQANKSFQVETINEEAAKAGFEVFHSVGCVACHAPRDATGNEKPSPNSTPLGRLANKYSVESLTSFLEDPLSVRPSGRMPNMKLSYVEAYQISNYLLQGSNTLSPPNKINADWAAEGKVLYTQHSCVSCHDPQASTPFKTLETVNVSQGCLSGNKGPWPIYDINKKDKAAIKVAIKSLKTSLSSEEKITHSLMQFDCTKCHQRGSMGGVSDEKNPYFKTTHLSLGEQGRLPPHLNNVGARLKSKWLAEVIEGGQPLRHYMTTRMPRFGHENVKHLASLFEEVDSLPEVSFPTTKDRNRENHLKKMGSELMSNKLACFTCHTFKRAGGTGFEALDLHVTSNRLTKDYFYHFLLDPQKHKPGTIMPSYWPGGKAAHQDILSGDTKLQIDAMWRYLSGEHYFIPKSLMSRSVEITGKDDEAVMLRRSYGGIGRRAISVAYPLKINLAYDVENFNLHEIWTGKFLNAHGAFNGQGEGKVNAIGDNKFRFAKGPSLALLTDANDPWPTDNLRDLGYQFKGYTLDEKRRPTFLYHLSDIKVKEGYKDIFENKYGQHFLDRHLTIRSPKQQTLYLKIAASKGKAVLEDNHVIFGDRMQVKVRAGSDVKIDVHEGSAILHLKLEEGTTYFAFEYHWLKKDKGKKK